MPYAQATARVQSSLDVLWRLLLAKIETPDASGVQACEVLEREDGRILRRVRTKTLETTERVVVDDPTHTITYTVLDHPHLIGYVTHRVAEPEDAPGSLDLTFTIDMTPKDPDTPDDHDLTPVLEAAVQEMKALAEDADRRRRRMNGASG